MYCKFCGAKNEDDAVFCSRCGNKLDNEKSNVEGVRNEEFASEKTDVNAYFIKKISDKTSGFIFKAIKGCLIAGIAGLAIFVGIVVIGLIVYRKVYLFDGYTFTKVITIISMVLMLIGVLGIISKSILFFVFKIGKFPETIVKRILLVSMAVACLSFSIWGFVSCGANNKSNSNAGSSSGNYKHTVSEYLGLELNVTSIKKSDSYTYVYCTVKNVSSKYGTATMYRYIKVKAVFYDILGNIIDTDWTYAVDSSWLNSGETKQFYYMVHDTSVWSAELSIV